VSLKYQHQAPAIGLHDSIDRGTHDNPLQFLNDRG
jgi:hypothetical protein